MCQCLLGATRVEYCRYARLATSDYQAPAFYRKLGYQLYGQLENCPAGETVYYFYKELLEIAQTSHGN